MAEQTDDEQIEQLKTWWRNYGNYLLTGVAVGLLLLFGWRYYQQTQERQAIQASEYYQQLLNAIDEKDDEAAESLMATLTEDYAATPYAALASLWAAKRAADAGESDGAKSALQWVIDRGQPEEIRAVARIRLARLLSADNQFDAALALLEEDELPASYLAQISELRGDIYVASGEASRAREAYQAALLAADSQRRVLIEMKLNSLVEGAAE